MDCLKSRQLVAENRYFSVFYDSLEENGQTPVKDYIVIQPKTRTKQSVYAVGVLPIKKGKVGLLDIFRHPIEENTWEIPGGFIERGETDAISAIRELEEEVGLICEPKNLHDLGTVATSPSTIAAKEHLFAATDCTLSKAGRTPELGHGQFKWFTKSEINSMINSGRIQGASTLIALFRAKNLF